MHYSHVFTVSPQLLLLHIMSCLVLGGEDDQLTMSIRAHCIILYIFSLPRATCPQWIDSRNSVSSSGGFEP